MIQIYDFVLIAWVPLSSFTLHWGTFSSTENCETAVKLMSYSNYHKRSTCDESFLTSISKELIVVLITDDLISCKNLDANTVNGKLKKIVLLYLIKNIHSQKETDNKTSGDLKP